MSVIEVASFQLFQQRHPKMNEKQGEMMRDEIPASLTNPGFSTPVSLIYPTLSATENISRLGSGSAEENEEKGSSPKKLKTMLLSPDTKSLPCMY